MLKQGAFHIVGGSNASCLTPDLLSFQWVGLWLACALGSGPRGCAGQVSHLLLRLPSGRTEARESRVVKGQPPRIDNLHQGGVRRSCAGFVTHGNITRALSVSRASSIPTFGRCQW
jgi:hypothetical protein